MLRLDLRGTNGFNNGIGDSVSSLEVESLVPLLNNRFMDARRHLTSLQQRVLDVSSKVLVTGDLNAGKSTLCNALVRKKVLPEDQQPCTSIFCEVVDALMNNGIEEVHAIAAEVKYDLTNKATYKIFPLSAMDDLVYDTENYSQLKIYVKDNLPPADSLLSNGVLDVSLIDAPGLNSDSIKTTALFARQEEIDVVVFVVSAENHFTLSAKEFIWNAANEKAYLFVVVNRFDNIRQKQKCRQQILDQLAQLSPSTYEHASELVHFVSAMYVLNSEPGTPIPTEFDLLESNLRSFILEKRSRSKLLPAKTYILNLLNDLDKLFGTNKDSCDQQYRQAKLDLHTLTPKLEVKMSERAQVIESTETTVEKAIQSSTTNTRTKLRSGLDNLETIDLPKYPGLISSVFWAEELRSAMQNHMNAVLVDSETLARDKVVSAIEGLKTVGFESTGRVIFERAFRPDAMFSNRRHQQARNLVLDLDPTFFIPSTTGFREFITTTASVSILPIVAGRFLDYERLLSLGIRSVHLVDNERSRKWVAVGITVAALSSVLYWAASVVPSSLPKNVAKVFRNKATEYDYVNTHSDRIGRECRRVLRVPEEAVREAITQSLEEQKQKKDSLTKLRNNSGRARDSFKDMFERVQSMKTELDDIELENNSRV